MSREGGTTEGLLKTTIVYCGKKKNDKFMGDWNNNGGYLGWTPGRERVPLYASVLRVYQVACKIISLDPHQRDYERCV
jgi:hypothetical protein